MLAPRGSAKPPSSEAPRLSVERETHAGRRVHPSLFFVLYFAFGASGGFLAGPVAYAYSNAGITTEAFAVVLSISLFPQVLKVVWAPLVDALLNPKAWYLIALAVVAPCLVLSAGLPIGPRSLPMLTVISVVVSIASSVLGMAADRLMAHDTAPDQRGAAGGWSQAGNLGGSGMAAGAGIWISDVTHSILLSGCVLAALCAACAAALLLAPNAQPPPDRPNFLSTLTLVVADCWQVCRARLGWLTLFLMVLPLGAGGAAQLFSLIAKEWRVGVGQLATINWLTGVATAVAAVVGGYICDRMDRRAAYALFGVLGGLTAALAAVTPHDPAWFNVFAYAYSAALGLSYAAFSAATLEAIGGGAAATKYTLFASVSNIPVVLMPMLDGWADTKWTATGLCWAEFLTAAAAAVLYATLALATRPRSRLAAAV
jgi:MFS family permease